jgi:triosephosphate isomerase
VKAVDPLGTQYKIEDYLSAFGMTDWFPAFFPLLFSVILSTLEFSVGVLLFFGVRKRASTTLAFLMMLVMTPLTLYLAVTNPVSDCGCFGDAWVLTNWQTFWKNVVLLVAAASVFAGRARIIRFVTAQTEWLVSLYTVLYILVFSSYCIRNLPVIDFRPYKIGKIIYRGMSIRLGRARSV